MKSKRVCAWCDKNMGESDAEKAIITHGICEECDKLVELYPLEVIKRINKLDEAVLILDSTATVIAGTDSALTALNKDFSEIDHVFPGDVINCLNAEKPGGCGKTSECTGCILRGMVEKTLQTGQSQKEKTAVKTLKKNNSEQEIKLVISTELVGKKVLLRIDSIEPV